jgi:nucleotide-binding universal stress UspA family protein
MILVHDATKGPTPLRSLEANGEMQQSSEGKMKHIVVPVDGSAAAGRAAKFASELLRGEGKITLLFIYDAPAAEMLGLGALSEPEIERMKNSLGKRSFEKASESMGSAADVEQVSEFGHPSRAIVAFAKAKSADLIVMGSRGLSAVQEVLLGSVSDYVLRHAHCPVTIVR